MGKIFVLSVTDHEEYILSRIMEVIAAEPGFDHTVSSHPCNILVFPGLELRLKERTVHRNGELISMTHREFATLAWVNAKFLQASNRFRSLGDCRATLA